MNTDNKAANTSTKDSLQQQKKDEGLVEAIDKVADSRQALLAELERLQKTEMVGRLAGSVADDLSNMLSVILGHAEIALSWIDSSHHLYENLQEIYKAAEQSSDLVRQLLVFARRQPVTAKIQDLDATISNMIPLLQHLVRDNIELIWKPARKQCLSNADTVQISQIISNLCLYACESIAGSGSICISLDSASISQADCGASGEKSPGDYVLIKVADTGSGMDEKQLAGLFKPGQAKAKAADRSLLICHEIVRQNGGFISVISTPGKGSEFCVYLPRHQETASGNSGARQKSQPGSDCQTILLVDDDVAMLGMTRKMLQGAGYNVISVERPTEAINLVKTNPARIDLLLTDLVMPEMNGRTLAKQIAELRSEIECLYMSGYGEKIVSHHGLMDQNVNFIAKPFTKSELLAAIIRILAQKGDLAGKAPD
ncbi:MAG: response regulator [Candidatus Riflebacteria bacterium]|nr:response regulator [Candidatus Riflebacteria bacterium]